jgi:tRNA (cytidine/uridine-2'-O-)-methyltransferase
VFEVILYQPEIPGNTGNIIRLCANSGSHLHLIEPLGFRLAHPELRRAGLDYADLAHVTVHRSLEGCLATLPAASPAGASPAGTTPAGVRLYALETGGHRPYATAAFRHGDALLFGPETRGLPETVLTDLPAGQRLSIPMRPGNRSLNLANAVALVVYEAWRQLGFS